MNNRYTLPIAFAVAVHASLMLGFRHPVLVRAATVNAPRPPVPLPPETIEIVPIEERQDATESASLPKESPPTTDPARRDEPDPMPMEKLAFAISPPKTSARSSDSFLFDPQPPGVPGGDLFGVGVGIIPAGALDKAPHAQVQATPDYPYAAKREGLNGDVVVEFLVDENGRVSNPAIVSSSNRMFEEPSLRAVMKWRFEPGRRDGRVVRFRMAVPVVFRLNDE